jgi:monoamine oxidase
MTTPTADHGPGPTRGATELRTAVQDDLTEAPDDGRDLDVAVVGGGVSGLYTAYRLAESTGSPFDPADIEVFELSDRVGGRLDSIELPGLEEAGELGGMRFDPDEHRLVNALVTDVFGDQLTVTDFPMGDPANHLRYLRGQRFRASAWTDVAADGEPFETRYHLDASLAGFAPGQLFRKVIHDVLAADPWFRETYGDRLEQTGPNEYHVRLDRREWNDVKANLTYEFEGPYEGAPLQELGMWTVLQDQLGTEGYEYLTDAIGYYALTANWNAAQAMADIALDFASEPSFRTLEGGFDLLAYALADALLGRGTTIRTRNPLRSFRETPDAERRYALTMEHRPTDTEWTVTADHLVLAMPRRSLELLDQYNFLFEDETVQRHVRSVLTQPALKLLMAFEEPWWRDVFGAEAGASITDLPIRQCYYFGTNEAADDDRSLFLASYDDERAVSFWLDIEDGGQRADPRLAADAHDGTQDEPEAWAAPDRMVEEAMAQVRELHDIDIPDPYAAYYRNWGRDPYGGGFNHWKPGVQIRDAMSRMRRPAPEQNVYVVGSAYSGRQGWVEGALCTAEKALQQEFGVERPPWLADEYYLGW